MSEYVKHSGFRFASAGERDPPRNTARFPEAAVLSGRDRADFVWRNVNAGVQAQAMVPDVLDLINEWRPDVLVREDTELGGCIAAERLGIPHATVQITAYRPRLNALIAAPINRLRATHGLAADADVAMLHRYLLLMTVPPTLRDPRVVLPATTHFMRPVAFDQSGNESLPAWVIDLPPQPTVYFTLGVGNADRLDVFAPFVQGLGGQPLNLIVTVSRSGNTSALGPLASNIRAEQYMPQTLLLPFCQAVAFHGGSGTMLSALEHALPMIIVPLAADQPDNADRCAFAGVARVLVPTELSPETVRAAVIDVLSEPAYRHNAQKVRAEMLAMPGPGEAVCLLEHLAGEQTPPP